MLITLTYCVRLPSGTTGPELTFASDKLTANEHDALAYALAEVQSSLASYPGDTRRTAIPLHYTKATTEEK